MKGIGLILNQGITLSLSAYEVSKKVIHLLRHSQTVQREEDGAVQFWRIKEHLQSQFPHIPDWSDDRWKACLAAGGRAKRKYQYCNNVSGTIVYFRAIQGHSGRNLIDPSLQDNVVIQSGFFHHIYHIGCAFNLHSLRHDWAIGEILLGSTVDQQPEGEVADSHEEKFLNTQHSPNQPNQSQNQSVIDQGNLITRKTCLLFKVKRPVLKRSV